MTTRLSAQDAMFLHLEGPNTPYHVASLMLFERGMFEERRLEALVSSRLDLVPRLRQKLLYPPLGQGRPMWADDEHFDLRYHVRGVSIPPPGTLDQVLEACSHLMEQHLDRARPLWELYLIDGVEGGLVGVFAKTHHAMVDGVSGMDVATVLLDTTPAAAREARSVWQPEPKAGARSLLRRALREQLILPLRAMRGAGRLVRHPARAAAAVVGELEGLGEVALASLRPAPVCPLNVDLGPNRKLAVLRASLMDFRSIKRVLGGTVNDVVLASVCGGLRDWFASRAELDESLELSAMVPVSLRAKDETGQIGNKVSTIIAPLPVGEGDAHRRYERIRDGTHRAKSSHQSVGADRMIQLSAIAPAVVLAQIAKVQGAQRFFNLSITNIPGPHEPLYADGHKLIDLFPFAPLAANMTLIVAVVSYAGAMEFGFTVDPEAIPDLDVIVAGVERSIADLKAVAERVAGHLARSP